MDRRQVLLAGLAAGNGASHTPVQVQKLFFLMDKTIASALGGQHFNFVPYAYGPFDVAVYGGLEELASLNLLEIDYTNGTKQRAYRLTTEGQRQGEELLLSLGKEVAQYLRRLSAWVRSLSFDQLVSAIYRQYPEMRQRSVFRR